ncbi:IS3 family transposase [Proteus sp. G2659]|nr:MULTISPECIES: IS3 family transposase [Proteus]NBM02389.1 IS3 family transposase [Proteus sp. G2671]NBM02695.1 IS3 family transposase [Proteus sp. G2671]NBM02755.1 IS3 family transposase [Proteus sp. G2671]NBM04709.1 IS3 family transposase [Proteus sp. G2671]NBM48353.1 IS3 family transposase [Proteus sp. G2666]
MAKYSLDFKLNVINFYLKGNSRLSTAKHFSINDSQVRCWCSAYQLHGIEGIKPRKSKVIYSLELKMHILSHMAKHSLSARETAALFNIPAFTTILEWKNIMDIHGIKALVPKKKGRPTLTKKKKELPKDDKDKSVKELLKELEYLRAENACLKKLQELGNKTTVKQRVAVVNQLKMIYPVLVLLRALSLSKSTFYYHQKNSHNSKDKLLKDKIKEIYHQHKGRYGYRRITAVLRNEVVINHKKVQRLMQVQGLKSIVRPKKYRSYKGQLGRIADNHLERNFNASKPNEKWVTDVTEFKVKGEKLYLSPILDLFNQEIVSYQIARRPHYNMIEQMLTQAFSKLTQRGELILHSDQGWQYQMSHYQNSLKKQGIIQSMSRKGNCLDNAVIENFFGILKTECFYTKQFRDLDELEEELHEYIKYYNTERIKIKLKGLSPVQYRTQSLPN